MRRTGPPALHFLAIGVALFMLERAAIPRRVAGPPLPAPLVLDPEHVAQLRADFERENGVAPTADDERALIAQATDDEILYREALARGLDRDDRSVRYRLVEKMRFIAGTEEGQGDEERLYRDALALHLDRDDLFVRRMLAMKMRLLAERAETTPAPDDTVLQAWLDRHPDRYREPERTTLRHVFVSSARGATAERDALALLAELRAGRPHGTGDPFPFDADVRGASRRELAKMFGEGFALAIAALPVGEWGGPIRSAHGFHLVRVEARDGGRVSPLAAVRPRVLAEVLEDGRRARLAAEMAALREKYGVTGREKWG